jgi:hypothetical protein
MTKSYWFSIFQVLLCSFNVLKAFDSIIISQLNLSMSKELYLIVLITSACTFLLILKAFLKIQRFLLEFMTIFMLIYY